MPFLSHAASGESVLPAGVGSIPERTGPEAEAETDRIKRSKKTHRFATVNHLKVQKDSGKGIEEGEAR
ncbi:MAG: hypothetical protein ACLVEJ_18580 [Parabacteroides sp.]